MKRLSSSDRLWLLVGLTEMTCVNVVGYIGISELVAFVLAPILFFKDMYTLKRDGFMPLLVLAVLSCVGSLVSSLYNHAEFARAARGFAAMYALFAGPVLFHHLLRRDMSGVKYYFIGVALSQVVTIFGFHAGAEAEKLAAYGAETVQSGPLFVMAHFGGLFTLPLYSFYLSSPTWLTAGCFIFPSVQAIVTSATGRSALMMTLIALFLVLFANRKVSQMRKFKKYFFAIAGGALLVILLFAQGYKVAAKAGLLNEAAQQKYETQIAKNKDKGLLGMIMGGRMEFFVGLTAAFDNPIFGLGPWAMDKNDYVAQFLSKYGTYEDLMKVIGYQEYAKRYGGAREFLLPIHSMLVGQWVYCGILGLPFWLYVFYKLLQLFRYHLAAVPQWFGVFAFMLPNNLWAIFFSPFGSRMGMSSFLSLVLIAIAVGKGKLQLPRAMAADAKKAEK